MAAPVRSRVLTSVRRKKFTKMGLWSAIAVVGITAAGVTTSVAIDPGQFARVDIGTPPAQVAEFSECMAGHGWEPMDSEYDDAVHFDFYPDKDDGNRLFNRDMQECRDILTERCGESIWHYARSEHSMNGDG